MNKFATEGVTPDVIDKVPTQKLNVMSNAICVIVQGLILISTYLIYLLS